MIKYVIALFFVIGSSYAFAQDNASDPVEVLTWEQCVQEAKAHHPDLVSAEAKVKENTAQKDITRSNALPQITSSLAGSTGATTGRAESKSFDYGVNGRQLLFDGFKTSNDVASARANIQAAQYNYDVVSSNVRLRLWTAFVDLLSAQENLNVVKDIAIRRQQSVDLVNLRYEDGREHQGSLLTAQANLAQAQYDVAQGERNLELSQRRLSKEMGREKFVPLTVQGQLEIKTADAEKPNFEELVSTVPFLRELAAQKEASRLGIKSAQSNFFPQVYANGSAGRTDTSWPPRSNDWSAGFTVSLPLFEGGLQQAQLSRARAVYEQTRADERSGRDGMIVTLAETWKNWQDDVSFVSVQQQFLNASQVRAKIAEAQYSSGLITFNDWIIIEDDLVRNQKEFVQSKANALISEAAWIQAKGGLLE